jgi:hypothetical protein
MGRSGTAHVCLGNHMLDWTMLDTGLYYGFYQLRYVPGRSTMCHNSPPLEALEDACIMPFDCFCGAAQPIMILMMLCLYYVCRKCRDLYGGSFQHSPYHDHTLTIPDQACPWQAVFQHPTLAQVQVRKLLITAKKRQAQGTNKSCFRRGDVFETDDNRENNHLGAKGFRTRRILEQVARMLLSSIEVQSMSSGSGITDIETTAEERIMRT